MPPEDHDSRHPSSSEDVVKFALHTGHKDFTHETQTNIFLRTIRVMRRGEKHHYAIGPVEITMPRDTSIEFHSTAIELLDTEARIAIVKNVLDGLDGHPALRKLRKEAE